MSNEVLTQTDQLLETEVALRNMAEDYGATAEGGPSRFTNEEIALLTRAADELEQAKQALEEISYKLPPDSPWYVKRAFEVDIV